MIGLALAAVLAVPSPAADAPRPKAAAKAAPTLSRASGKIIKTSATGVKTPSQGRITVADDAGRIEDFRLDAKTRTTCDDQKTTWGKSAMPDVCDRAVRILYDPQTKRVAVLELKSALKADADDAQTRPNVSGEVAATDVIAGKISVRLGGGATVDFKVGDATKILSEAEGRTPADVSFESIKVGDRVEVRSKDWKAADEIRVRSAAR